MLFSRAVWFFFWPLKLHVCGPGWKTMLKTSAMTIITCSLLSCHDLAVPFARMWVVEKTAVCWRWCPAGDAGGRSGRPAGDSAVGGLSVCPPSLPGDGQQPPVIWWVSLWEVDCFLWKVCNENCGRANQPVSSVFPISSSSLIRWSSRTVQPRRAGATPLPSQRRSLAGRLHRAALQLLLLQSVSVPLPLPPLCVCQPLLFCPCSPREKVPLHSLLDLLPYCLLYNVSVRSRLFPANQFRRPCYFKMKHFSSALRNGCSEFPLCSTQLYVCTYQRLWTFPGIQQNLHIVLIMDCSSSTFTINCESNPAFYRKCSVQWMEGWSECSMKKVSVEGTDLARCLWLSVEWSRR